MCSRLALPEESMVLGICVELIAKSCCRPYRDGVLGVIGVIGEAIFNDSDFYNLRMTLK